MNLKNRTYILILILFVIVFVVEGLTLSILYSTTLEQQREQLVATAKSQAQLMESVARFDAMLSQTDNTGDAEGATLKNIHDSQLNLIGFGETGEFVLGKLENNNIVFLLQSRFKSRADSIGQNQLFEIGGLNAEPMQLALAGKSGTVIARDYRGEMVLAAYEPVGSLNYGVITKINLNEIQQPFIRVGAISMFVAMVLIAIGSFLFIRVTNPMIKQLKDSDAYNRMLFESSAIGLALCRMDGSLVDINSAYANIMGRSVDETKKLTYWDITPEDYAEDEQRQLEILNTSGRYGPYEKEYLHKDGHRVPVSLLGHTFVQDGEKYIWSSVEDISERKEVEQALVLSEGRLNEAQHLAKVGSWELNLLNNHLFWSDEIFNIFEIDKSQFDASYDAFLNAIHPEDRDRVNQAYTDSLINRDPYEIEHRLQMSDGTIKYVRETCESFFVDDKAVRSVGTIQDITDIIIAEEELKKYREHLEELVDERTKELRDTQNELVRKERLATLGQLTATVSHELRNPLGAMKPSLYVIKKKSDKNDERVQQAIERVDRNIDRCDRIIDELLDFTRITELDQSATSIDEWLESVIDDQVINKNILVEKDFSLKGVELSIDNNRLRRAVINVVENACHSMLDDKQQVKDNEYAQLNIKTQANDELIEIVITDTGSGIAEDILEKIFEPLFSTKGFGVGLGMPTVKQIMQQHGGGIEVNSDEGKGTVVILWLPDTQAKTREMR